MIRRPDGWVYERRPDRVLLTVSRPDFVARVRYLEKLQPLERIGDLLQRHCEPFPTPASVKRIVTIEGEYGAVIDVEYTPEQREVRSFAFIFGDESYSMIEGISSPEHIEQLRAAVHDLALSAELRLGLRQRRYLFQPPPLNGLVIGDAIAHYFPEEYPCVDARITVFPAVPLASDRQPMIDLQRLVGEHILVNEPGTSSGFVVQERESPVPFHAISGLAGTRWRYRGFWHRRACFIRDLILLRDDLYAYAVELSVAPEHHSIVVGRFEDLVHSIQPIPRRTVRGNDAAFTHWAE